VIRLGLLGWPLAHSLSPKLQNAALSAVGLEGEYKLYPVDPAQPEKLAEFVNKIRAGELIGLNVTIPYKQSVIPYMDVLTPAASRIGAVNAIYLREGRIVGHNTDAFGFETDLQNKSGKILNEPGTALVLGAGGSARAVISTLLEFSWKVTIAARNVNQARLLRQSLAQEKYADNLDCILLDLEDLRHFINNLRLIVNATPVGMFPQNNYSPWPETLPFPSGAFVYDLVYNPNKTLLVKQTEAAGLSGANGLGMLVEQASQGFEIWTGRPAPRDVMYSSVAGSIN